MRQTLDYRPFLDGLRAVAVLGVIFYHLDLPGFPGGFLGVDVFFVLSGYLITSLLLAEKRGGGIDFAGFYARRLKRLLPALLLLLAVLTTGAGLLYAAELRYVIARDAAASLAYVANWSFIHSGQSYFEAFGDPSPLRHMWSLAVEEQFYLLWPLVLLLLPTGRRRALVVVALLIAVSAALLTWLYDPADASRAYYGTDARLHEPLIGALAALAWNQGRARLAWTRHVVLPCAAAVIAAMVLLDDDAAIYYRGGSVLFSAAVALVILGLESGARAPARMLSSLPLVWTGKISYGLYLWHWPIIIALSSVRLGHPAARAALVIALTYAIAALSYHLVERPIRQSRTLLGRPFTSPRVLAAAAAAMALVAVPIALRYRGSTRPAWAGGEVSVSGTGAYRVALIGDSVLRSTLPGWQALAGERGWSIIDGTMGGCSVAGGYQMKRGKLASFARKCVRERPGIFERVIAEHPDVVVWASQSEMNGLMDMDSGEARAVGSPEHDALLWRGWEEALGHFPGIPVAIVSVVHAGPQRTQGCVDRADGCADDGTDGIVDHLNAQLQKFVAAHPGTHWISIAPVVCPAGPPCPENVAGMRIRPDGYHFAEEAAPWVARAIAERLPR